MATDQGIRAWQREALQSYKASLDQGRRSLLWEATPGAGKTRAALLLAVKQLRAKLSSRLLVVVPTAHLKIQWARAAQDFNIRLSTSFSGEKNGLPADFHGAVVTYQQVANQPKNFHHFASGALAILDEVHHSADGLSWGDSLLLALEKASFILCLSGTPFRSDTNPIPFVQYNKGGLSVPDYGYNYSRAVVEGVCRPTVFFSYGGDVAWSMYDNVVQAGFSDNLDKMNAARRLRAALDPSSGWLEPLLKDAHSMLLKIRKVQPSAGALLVAANQDHARAFAAVLKGVTGASPVVVLSDDATASKKIKSFAANDVPWLVACNMVSEGVDIPRLRIGVYGTTIRTRMYFRQFLGRIVRQTKEPVGVQIAYCYLPADPRLQAHAREIESEQRHSLTANAADEFFQNLAEGREDREKNENAFASVHAINSGLHTVIVNGGQLNTGQLSLFGDAFDSSANQKLEEAIEREVHSRFDETLSHSELKDELGREIKNLVNLYQKRSGKPHASIHSLLNSQQSVRSQANCTMQQLEKRVRLLQKFIQEER